MMNQTRFRRAELEGAELSLGAFDLDLSNYATTGLRIVALGPSGVGKTNLGLLVAEQLASKGWVCVLVDPEGELEAIYGGAVPNPSALRATLKTRQQPIVVVSAPDADAFTPYGEAIMQAASDSRKPIFVMLDEGQVFSHGRRRADGLGASTDVVNQFFERGRKRALDVFVTAQRFSGTVHRSIFANRNVTLVARQEDSSAWSTLAPLFQSSRLNYSDLAGLMPGEFICISRGGIDKLRLPLAEALSRVAPPASRVRSSLPTSFSEWDRAMAELPTERLQALDGEVVSFLASICGLTTQQILSGTRALQDELEARV